jgi:hypothetical protein
MGIFLVNNLSFNFDISLILLYYCIYKTDPKVDPAYVFLLYIVDKDEIITYLNMLKTPDQIKDLEMEFEGYLLIEENYTSFLKKYAGKRVVPQSYKYIMYGFNETIQVGQELEKAKISPFELKKALCITSIDMNNFIDKQLKFSNIDQNHQDWFTRMLQNEFKDEKSKRQLFKFWGATNAPVSGKDYKVVKGAQRGYFQSHTCFYTIDMPIDINSEDILKERLMGSITMGSDSIDLYGGN